MVTSAPTMRSFTTSSGSCVPLGILDGDVKLVEIDGLADEVVGAELEGGFDVVELRVGGDHDDGAGVAIFLELIEDLDAGEVGHANVEQDEVGGFVLCEFEGGEAGIGFDDVVSPLFAFLPKRPADEAFVIDDHDLLGHWS